jgi:serine/threonine protein kinase
MEYAIKKIKLETKNKSVSAIVNELEEILTEIRCFAKIKHKHIVRYNHSWIEIELKVNLIYI